MDKVTTAKLRKYLKADRNDFKADKSDGFKFAVALIVAFSTIGDRIYYYVNNNPVNDNLWVILNILIPISLTILGLIVYITIKGISLEINNPKMKEKYAKTSSLIYISTFKLLIFYTIVVLCYYTFRKNITHYFDQDELPFIKVLFTLVIFGTLFKILDEDNSKKSAPYIFFVCVVTSLVLSGFLISPYLLTGEIKVEMGDIYYTNDTRIPIDIVNTGYNGNITIKLNETNTEENTSTLDSIKLNPDNSNETISGKYLYTHTLSHGEYKVFIDTTNLTQGYYQLSFSEESQKSHWMPIVERVFPLENKKYSVFYIDRD